MVVLIAFDHQIISTNPVVIVDGEVCDEGKERAVQEQLEELVQASKRKVEEKIKYKLAAISGYKVFAIQLYITYICSSNQNSHLPV